MIDLHTGAIVGIDFGHAFGSATQVTVLKSKVNAVEFTWIFFIGNSVSSKKLASRTLSNIV